jgi:hypothetical protein
MEKQEARQAEMDARHQDNIDWRNTVRKEDTEWRRTIRDEDKAWRVQLRKEDTEHRSRTERTSKRCCALSAAAQVSKPGTPTAEIFDLAVKFEVWLNSPKD